MEQELYTEAYSSGGAKGEEGDGADLLFKVLDRGDLNRTYERVKANEGACRIYGMTVRRGASLAEIT